jgi:hypothetical protein
VADPIPTTGLALWVRGDAGVTTDTSGNVSLWADQSSQHNDLSQTTASLRPQWVESGINGLPLLRFDGSGDFLSFTTRLTTVRSVFWVVKSNGPSRFLLGDTSAYDFHPSGSGLWEANYSSPNIRAGHTWLNGSPIDGTTTTAPASMSVISLVTTGNVAATTFSRDRNGAYWEGSPPSPVPSPE